MRPSLLLAAGVFLAAGALLSVYAVAEGRPPSLRVPLPSGELVFLGWLLLGLAVVAALGNAVVARLRHRRPARRRARDSGASFWPIAAIAGGIVLVSFFLVALVLSLLEPPEELPSGGPPPGVEREVEETEAPELAREAPNYTDPRAVLRVLLIAAAVATAALLVVYVARVRARPRPQEAEGDELAGLRRELAAGLRIGLEEILAVEDYREAVIACYARMERSFAAAGFPRTEAETPFEYLARVAREALGVAAGGGGMREALTALTGLYEIARFSEHPVDSRDRSRAIVSLQFLEEALTRTPAPAGERA